MRTIASSVGLLVLLALAGCGASAPSHAARLRTDLAATLSADGREASDSARRAREAVEEASRSEAAGSMEEADEHASRARAWAEVDLAEREVGSLEERLGALEAELLSVEAEASASEHASADRRARTLADADARAAQEELARAYARAEADESAPRRARRLGLTDGPEVRRLADVLLDRARVLVSAARAMGAATAFVEAADRALAEAAALEEPAARLAAADRAHGLSRAALADARHSAASRPPEEEIAALTEALASEGFAPLRDERGLGARLPDAFEGNGLATASRGRLRRLGELVASHPIGPILLAVESDASPQAQAQAQRRLDALRRAIVGDREREVLMSIAVEVRVPGSVPPTSPNAARVVLPAYVPRAPAPIAGAAIEAGAPAETTEPAGE